MVPSERCKESVSYVLKYTVSVTELLMMRKWESCIGETSSIYVCRKASQAHNNIPKMVYINYFSSVTWYLYFVIVRIVDEM